MNKKRVLLGMSGGVDSSASAVILLSQGYEVIGCTLDLWGEEKSNQAVIDAKKVCEKLNIEHYVFSIKEEFKTNVIDNFILEYENARTPNPCVECNKFIKFGYLFDKLEELKCDFLATGHYAGIEFSEKYNQYVLLKAKEIKKDQTYFLYTIKKEQLEKIIFPLESYTNKEEIRNIAKEAGLEVATKKESQEICFIPNNDYQDFLQKNLKIKNKNGKIVLKTGEILGEHKGIINYTIGQRKGIGVSYKEPIYVVKLDKEKNSVVVGFEKDLYSKELIANNVNWVIEKEKFGNEFECFAKVRYRAKEAKAKVIVLEEDKIKMKFEEEQRAITKGQSVVLYDENNILLGGAIIM